MTTSKNPLLSWQMVTLSTNSFVKGALMVFYLLSKWWLIIFFRNLSQSLVRGRYEDSTKNLLNHARKCEPADSAQSQQLAAFANGSTYSAARLWYLLAMWCARHHRPFNIVKDDKLNEIFLMLYARVEVPHPTTVSRDVKEIFHICKKNVAEFLQVCIQFSLKNHTNDNVGPSWEDPYWHRRMDVPKRILIPWIHSSLGHRRQDPSLYSRFHQVSSLILLRPQKYLFAYAL